MLERRNFRRIEIDTVCMIFVEGYGVEIMGEVTDVSEESIGIRFPMTKELGEKIDSLNTVNVQFVDTYRDGSLEKTAVVQASAYIKRRVIEENSCFIGCVVRDEAFREYVVKRKMSLYFK